MNNINQMISINDNLYSIIRRIKINNKPILAYWKVANKCDSVFKKDGYYYLCRKIEEIEFKEISYVNKYLPVVIKQGE